ncbi:MAG: 6-phosphogluconolactonase [Vicinamibacteria bacterium]|nr:6-phosphogluconolactonase [Vicinamibacteria bacterium]
MIRPPSSRPRAPRVIVTRDFDHMSEVAAGIVRDRISRTLAARGSFVIGLATGNSPTGLYKILAKAANAGDLDVSRIVSFNLDEYVGLPGENAQARALHRESYSFFMIQELFGLLRTKFREVNVPWGCLIEQSRLIRELEAHPRDWQEQGSDKGKAVVIGRKARSQYLRWVKSDILDAYERKIRRRGGIDLHVIGVGERGHVAFHEAGVPFARNRMLLVRLDDNTVANAIADGHFATKSESPRYAISMGAELVFKARCVVMLASGKRKAEPVAASLAEKPTDAVPISYGQIYAKRGGDLIYVLDREAAAAVLAARTAIEGRGVIIENVSARSAVRRLADLGFSRDPATGLLG